MTPRTILILLLMAALFPARPAVAASGQSNLLVVQAIEVNGKRVPFQRNKEVDLGPSPERVVFFFGPNREADWLPIRVQAKLEGFDKDWHIGGGEMYFIVRFLNAAGDRLDKNQGQYKLTYYGNSPGWTGDLTNSALAPERETLTVPPGASQLWIVLSSAGPPSTMGIFVVDDLTVSRVGPDGKSEVLLRSPFGQGSGNQTPVGWTGDGVSPSMAKVVEIGHAKSHALAIMDSDRYGHVEWHNDKTNAPSVSPGDQLVIDWNEMYSIGESLNRSVTYSKLPPGLYHLRVQETDLFGKPTGVESEITIRVPLAIWKTTWFWALVAALVALVLAAVIRYIARRRMQFAMRALQQQRAIEEERLRIARDIHDDLGARVTQISLLSAMAQNDAGISEKARAQFDRITVMSRDLVSALYETVWAVNPENDNLDAMVNHLCERINEFCDPARLRCRLHVSDFPKDIAVTSRVRHNISMAVQEAMHNVVKHAHASQVTVHITLDGPQLTVSIEDDGCGFDTISAAAGNGLVNIRRRMEQIGGSCDIRSELGEGTTVFLRLDVRSPNGRPSAPALEPEPPLVTAHESD